MYATEVDIFWFKVYFTQRTQPVHVVEKVSIILHVSYSVPQGSVLGPIPFTIFVNDLVPHVNHSLLIQYADDSQFIISDEIEDTLKTVKLLH